MKVLYVSSFVHQKYFDEIFEKSQKKPIQNIQKFNNLFIEGLKKQNEVDDITVLTNVPINRSISKEVLWLGKKYKDNNTEFIYLPFINFKFLKQFCLSLFCLIFIIYWCLKNYSNNPVIISDGFYPINSTICTIIGKLFGFKIYTLYTDLPKCDAIQVIEKQTFFKRLVKFIINIGDNINIYLSDGFILLTEKMNEIVNKNKKPYVVMEGLADINYCPKNKNRKKAIMYAGGLYEKYGVKLLIDAFLEWNNPEYELWLCGGDGNLIDYINNLNSKNIIYFGALPNEEVLKLEEECKLLVNPRFTKDAYTKYSFPSKNIEYMLSGTPFLTTKLEGIPEEYYDYVYFIEEETKEGFIKKFNEILGKDNKELNEFGKKAQKFVKTEKNNIVQTKKISEFLKNNNDKNKIENNLINVYLIYSFALLLLSMLNLYGLYNVSINTYIIYIINILFTIFGIRILAQKIKVKKRNDADLKKKNLNIKKILDSKSLFIFLVVWTVIMAFYCIRYFSLISGLPQEEYRMVAYTSLYGNALGAIFFLYFVSNIGLLSTIFLPMIIFDKNLEHDHKQRTMFLTFLIFTFYSLIGLGRMSYLKLLYAIFFVIILFCNIKKVLTKKNLKLLVSVPITIFALCCIIIYIRVFSSNFNFSNLFNLLNYQLKQIFEYFLGPFRTLDYFIKNGFIGINHLTLGRATFAGVDEIITYPIKLFFDNVLSFNQIIGEITQVGISIGKNTPYFNAFYTLIMNFYLDFGLIGVMIFSLLHGLFIKYIINLYEDNNTIITKLLLILVSINLFMGIFKWEYQSGNITFLIIILLILANINKIKKYMKR